MSSSVDSALATIFGYSRGLAERIMISPRLVGRQFDRPMEKPGQGSGVRIGRSPALGMTVKRPGNRAACSAGRATDRCGKSRRHCSCTGTAGRSAQQILHADQQLPPPGAQDLVERRLATLEDEIDAEVILQVAADILVGVHDVDAEAFRMSAGPMPESCKSCGELIAPAGKDHFATGARNVFLAVLLIFDADRALPSNRMLCRQRIHLDAQIGRFIAGRRKARAADMRRPRFVLIW